MNYDRKRAEKALGKPLRRTALVHHYGAYELVLCEDRTYHSLLHKRARQKGLHKSMAEYAGKENLLIWLDPFDKEWLHKRAEQLGQTMSAILARLIHAEQRRVSRIDHERKCKKIHKEARDERKTQG